MNWKPIRVSVSQQNMKPILEIHGCWWYNQKNNLKKSSNDNVYLNDCENHAKKKWIEKKAFNLNHRWKFIKILEICCFHIKPKKTDIKSYCTN